MAQNKKDKTGLNFGIDMLFQDIPPAQPLKPTPKIISEKKTTQPEEEATDQVSTGSVPLTQSLSETPKLNGKSPTPQNNSPASTPRKRRKDYIGEKKKDYHKNSTMLGVRLSTEVAQLVRAYAAAESQSVNTWLANLIHKEIQDKG